MEELSILEETQGAGSRQKRFLYTVELFYSAIDT